MGEAGRSPEVPPASYEGLSDQDLYGIINNFVEDHLNEPFALDDLRGSHESLRDIDTEWILDCLSEIADERRGSLPPETVNTEEWVVVVDEQTDMTWLRLAANGKVVEKSYDVALYEASEAIKYHIATYPKGFNLIEAQKLPEAQWLSRSDIEELFWPIMIPDPTLEPSASPEALAGDAPNAAEPVIEVEAGSIPEATTEQAAATKPEAVVPVAPDSIESTTKPRPRPKSRAKQPRVLAPEMITATPLQREAVEGFVADLRGRPFRTNELYELPAFKGEPSLPDVVALLLGVVEDRGMEIRYDGADIILTTSDEANDDGEASLTEPAQVVEKPQPKLDAHAASETGTPPQKSLPKKPVSTRGTAPAVRVVPRAQPELRLPPSIKSERLPDAELVELAMKRLMRQVGGRMSIKDLTGAFEDSFAIPRSQASAVLTDLVTRGLLEIATISGIPSYKLVVPKAETNVAQNPEPKS